MTAPRDPDARIVAFFEASQPDLPDRAFDAVRRDIHRTRQLVVIGPFREPDSFPLARFAVAAAVVLTVGIVVLSLRPVAGPGGVPGPTPKLTIGPSSSITPSTAASPSGPTVFISPQYGYTVTAPPGWIVAPALLRWNGTNQPGPDAESDKLAGPRQLTVWAFAGPFGGDLAAFVADRIAANARDHADTCPANALKTNEPLEIRGQSWVLLAWDCGALINQAITVRGRVAYAFVLRDLDIRAATDPADRAILLSILDSVELPN